MASAVFTSSLTYEPGGGGTITQGFRTTFNYTAVSAGKWDVATGSVAAVVIPFGGVAGAQGLLIQNNTDVDADIKINASASLYHLPPGGMIMHWSPAKVGAGHTALGGVTVTPSAAPAKDGSFDFIILGA